MDIRTIALNMLKNNPNLVGNPNAQSMIDVIESGDSARGETIANNILETYGVGRDEAIGMARRFFGI